MVRALTIAPIGITTYLSHHLLTEFIHNPCICICTRSFVCPIVIGANSHHFLRLAKAWIAVLDDVDSIDLEASQPLLPDYTLDKYLRPIVQTISNDFLHVSVENVSRFPGETVITTFEPHILTYVLVCESTPRIRL